jgi:hypothetical protein
MRECQQCGEANQASSRFCVVCGAPLAVAPEVVSRSTPVDAPEPPPAAPPVSPGGTGRPGPAAAAGPSRELGADFPLDGPRTLVGFLVSYENVDVGQYWPVHQGRNVLGRQGAATGLDIEILHPTTSSLHALLLALARPGRIVVEDTSSTNGTFVNDNMLTPGQRWELRDGDRVRFGLFNAVIKIIDRT